MKGDHEPSVEAWSSNDRSVSGLDLLLKCIPVELVGQLYQGMVEVDDGLEFGLKEVWLDGGNRGLRLHGFSQFFSVVNTPNTAKVMRTFHHKTFAWNNLSSFSA
jgi:hypothetical protein